MRIVPSVKAIFFLLVVLLVAGALPARAQNTPARLRVMVPLDTAASFDQALTEAVRRFNSSQNAYRVELLRKGTPFQNLRMIIASHFANDLPDLALINEADVPTLCNLGIVRPFPEKWFAGKKFLPELASRLKCNGQPCSSPFQRRVAAWYFNRELLFKLNQSTEHIPTNWAALSALSQRLKKKGELWGLGLSVAGDFALPRWSALGLSLSGNTSPADASADFAHKLWTSRGNWLPGGPSLEEASRRFIEQRAVVLLGSIEQSAYLKANSPFKLGSALPDGELAWFGTDFVVLSPVANVADGARAFLDYLYRPEVSVTLFQAAASLPVTRAQAANAGWKKEIEQAPLVKAAVSRKLKSAGLEKIPPQIREEWAMTIWKAVEQDIPAPERGAKSVELRNALQKLLSTNPR